MTIAMYQIITLLFRCYTWLLIAALLSSWFPDIQHMRIVQFVRWITEPYFRIFRNIIPPIGMLDISPILAFFALQILEVLIKSILFS